MVDPRCMSRLGLLAEEMASPRLSRRCYARMIDSLFSFLFLFFFLKALYVDCVGGRSVQQGLEFWTNYCFEFCRKRSVETAVWFKC